MHLLSCQNKVRKVIKGYLQGDNKASGKFPVWKMDIQRNFCQPTLRGTCKRLLSFRMVSKKSSTHTTYTLQDHDVWRMGGRYSKVRKSSRGPQKARHIYLAETHSVRGNLKRSQFLCWIFTFRLWLEISQQCETGYRECEWEAEQIQLEDYVSDNVGNKRHNEVF